MCVFPGIVYPLAPSHGTRSILAAPADEFEASVVLTPLSQTWVSGTLPPNVNSWLECVLLAVPCSKVMLAPCV